MNMICAGNWPQLALAKTARKRYVKELGDDASIVVLLVEHVTSPTGARKDQCGTDIRIG